jgi:small neutral amino acid transporter SnatA (MarC family)
MAFSPLAFPTIVTPYGIAVLIVGAVMGVLQVALGIEVVVVALRL